jgi:hypothetical protein
MIAPRLSHKAHAKAISKASTRTQKNSPRISRPPNDSRVSKVFDPRNNAGMPAPPLLQSTCPTGQK